MTIRRLSLVVFVLILLYLGFSLGGFFRRESPAAERPASRGAAALKEILSGAELEPAKFPTKTGPRPGNGSPKRKVVTSDIDTVLQPGQMLVTGGYPTRAGRREFIMIAAERHPEPGYPDQIKLTARVMDLDPAAMGAAGLEDLESDRASTRQHGQIWEPEEAKGTLEALTSHSGATTLNRPTLMTKPGLPASITMGHDGNDDEFLLETMVGFAADGSGITLELEVKSITSKAAGN
ncbi:hypothetical protein OKA05_20760 [Luteolibacter arcticus]|uniref:LPS export ABC transporter periplasmic protein LptC n=1 Tax=Luteolibacter arcticus TaxID=1581411 RepID=A0ABT3GNB0_9BACT|nr:hypothetical protein [Luteolibacter arcticus]MCW1925006.1 hypothetical protein [Luteolibacter arcticus]